MTATSLGLNGQPVKFLGAYVKNVSSSLGLSTSPSTVNITLAEDECEGVLFEPPELGSFHVLEVGPTWKFSGIITRYDRDVTNISGRVIRVTMADPREIMKSVPVILAPGSEIISETIRAGTACSVLDVYSAFQFEGGLFNLSGWNSAGMPFSNVAAAINGENIRIGEFLQPVQQQTVNVFGQTYRFNITEVSDLVELDHRINTNLTPFSNIIEDLSTKHSFDWYIESEQSGGIVDVTTKVIDRSQDSTALGLQEFLDLHPGRVVSATSGVELRNEVSCLAMQGAPVEQLLKLNILGLANEPIDLSPESGVNNYVMTEAEMRVVIEGKQQWEIWLTIPSVLGGGGGFSRYGAQLSNEDIPAVVNTADMFNLILSGSGNIIKNGARNRLNLLQAKMTNAGKVYEKLKSHADATYGKRWVHSAINDDVIDSAWTRDVVAGNDDPNEFFRQDDGRTRAYVEFSSEDAGGAFSLGLNNLTQLFGDTDIFRNVTVFGNTFANVLAGEPGQNGAILVCELDDAFQAGRSAIKFDKDEYIYNDAEQLTGNPVKISLFVAATVDKDGVVRISSPVLEDVPDPYDLLIRAAASAFAGGGAAAPGGDGGAADAGQPSAEDIAAAASALAEQIASILPLGTLLGIDDLLKPDRLNQFLVAQGDEEKEDADGVGMTSFERITKIIQQYYGPNLIKTSARCFQPKYVYIPVRSKFNRYGPVFSSDLGPDTQGKLEILQDDGFAPWEFGGVSLMLDSMQLKVDNASSTQKEIFSANIVIEGFPEFNIGDAIEKNANINNINISFGSDGVKTTYRMQTFTRKFGEFSKEDFARLALFSTNGGEAIIPRRAIEFNQRHRFGVNKNVTGRGSPGGGASTGGAKGFG